MSRQTQHKVEVNSIATKTSIVATKVQKNVATQKIISRHNEKLKPEIFVTTIIEKFFEPQCRNIISSIAIMIKTK